MILIIIQTTKKSIEIELNYYIHFNKMLLYRKYKLMIFIKIYYFNHKNIKDYKINNNTTH